MVNNLHKSIIPKSGQDVELYKSILGTLQQTVFLFDRNKNLLEAYNTSCIGNSNYNVDSFIGSNITDLLADSGSALHDSFVILNNAFDRLLRTGLPQNFSCNVDGECFESTVSFVGDGYVVSHLRNISSVMKKQLDFERVSRNELAMAMTAGGLTSWSYDVETRMFTSTHENNVIGSGMSYDEVMKKIIPEHRQLFSDMFQNIISGKLDKAEVTLQVTDRIGKLIWANVHAIPQLFGRGGKVSVIVGSQKDVTKILFYEKNRNELLKQNQLIMNNANCGFVYITPDYKVAWENATKVLRPEFEDGTYFFEQGELCYKNEIKLSNSHTRRFVNAAFNERKIQRIAEQMPSKVWIEMTVIPVISDSDTVEGVVIKIEDITRRVESEREIAEKNKRLHEIIRQNQVIMNNANCGFVYLTPDYTVVWENISGIFRDPMSKHYRVGERCYDALGRYEPCNSCVMRKAMESRQTSYAEFTTQSGTTVEIFGNPVLNDCGEIEGVILRVSDISAQKSYIRKIETSEQKIEANNKLLTTVINSMPCSLFIKDADDDYRYLIANKNFCEVLGAPEKDIIGKNDYELFPKEYADKYRETDMLAVQSGVQVRPDESIPFEGGVGIWYTIKTPLWDSADNKNLLIGVGLDITEIRTAAEKVKKSQQATVAANRLLTTVMNAMPCAFFVKDVNDNYRYILANRQLCELTGDLELLGKTDYDIFKEDADKFRADDISIMEEGKTRIYEELMTDPKGREHIWHTTKLPLVSSERNEKLLIGLSLDVTQRVKEQRETEYRKALLEFAFRAGGIIPWEWDYDTGKMHSDTEISVLYGKEYTLEEYTEAIIHPDHKSRFLKEFCDLRDEIAKELDTRVLTLYKGVYEWKHIVGKSILDPRTGRPKCVGIGWFITEEVRKQEELALAKKKAEQSDALKSAFLANMSHEIRTPLNALVGFSELITMAETPEEKENYMNIIHANSELLLRLINDILDLSKIEAGYVDYSNTSFDLVALYSDLKMAAQRRVKPGVKLICNTPQEKCFVLLDKFRVSQLVNNFLTNACKFTDEGYIEMGYREEKSGIVLYVKDTGCGISPENQKKVFERFEKLDNFTQGTGLGMAICKAITEAYNGEIGVSSVPGRGSTFWAWLPTEIDTRSGGAEDGEAKKIFLSHSRKDDDKSSINILVAEDNDSNYLLMKALLKGYNLVRAVNGAEAVNKVSEGNFDVVFMDVRMPVMDGLEATRIIRQFNTEIPIVAVTANAFESDRRKAVDAGCTGFISKPIDRQKLAEILGGGGKSLIHN